MKAQCYELHTTSTPQTSYNFEGYFINKKALKANPSLHHQRNKYQHLSQKYNVL